MGLLLGQHQPRAQMELWFQRGLQSDPDNFHFYMLKCWCLLILAGTDRIRMYGILVLNVRPVKTGPQRFYHSGRINKLMQRIVIPIFMRDPKSGDQWRKSIALTWSIIPIAFTIGASLQNVPWMVSIGISRKNNSRFLAITGIGMFFYTINMRT